MRWTLRGCVEVRNDFSREVASRVLLCRKDVGDTECARVFSRHRGFGT